jgi:hypothetical protein
LLFNRLDVIWYNLATISFTELPIVYLGGNLYL